MTINKLITLNFLFLSFAFAEIYDIGETISYDHQNLSYDTCYSGNGYDLGDDWKLADWNGEINGGNYNVIVIIMSASW